METNIDKDCLERAILANNLNNSLRDMMVEVLRAVSIGDPRGKSHKATRHLLDFLEAVQNVDGVTIGDVIDKFDDIIMKLRGENIERHNDVFTAIEDIATASGKVLAERVSGVSIQGSRAESRLFQEIAEIEQLRAENRLRYGR